MIGPKVDMYDLQLTIDRSTVGQRLTFPFLYRSILDSIGTRLMNKKATINRGN